MNGSRLGQVKSILFGLLACWLSLASVAAHDAPTSFMDLQVGSEGIDASVTASNTDLAHELPSVEPDMLLQPAVIEAQRDAFAAIIQSRLQIAVAGKSQRAELRKIVSLPEKRDLRLDFHYSWSAVPSSFAVRCRLFPYDPRHRTFLNIHQGGQLEQQQIFEGEKSSSVYHTGSGQSVGEIVRQFFFEGLHHIFSGPDHILFVVGLLLLGGGVGRLLKIVTTFTVAHSITLGLATFQIVSPPASLIEPAIALSIVFVGASAFLGTKRHDPRLLFAFSFGLIHGFGFANALQEMMLPRQALGWSLFAFNGGVEFGQACIVLAVAPILALLRSRNPVIADRVVAAGALCVTTAGAFWFFQRVMA
jgi:hydrogenase/urease accessory protein HupE